jgi:hypothetical protein
MSKKVKIFAIVVVLISVAILAFSFLGNKTPPANTTGLSTTALTATPAGMSTLPGMPAPNGGAMATSSFLQVLSTIDSITLDTTIFSDPGYKALRDFPVSLGTAVVGRDNPFAPIGTDSSAGTPDTAMQVQTLAPGKIISTGAEFGALVTTTSTAPTTVVFEYGLDDTFGSSSSPVTVTKNGTALFTATGLTPATTYSVKAVAVQGSATATGSIMTFTTAAAQKKQ